MKYLATLIIILAGLVTRAQTNSNSLLGSWELTDYTYDNNTATPQASNFKRYKIFTPSHFVVIDVNAQTNITRTSIMGTYSLKDSTYTEKILHVNEESQNMIGADHSFVIKFEANDVMFQQGAFNGMKTDEKWKRVTISESKQGQ